MNTVEMIAQYGHEEVAFFTNEAAKLKCIIAIHSTKLGPALGAVGNSVLDLRGAGLLGVDEIGGLHERLPRLPDQAVHLGDPLLAGVALQALVGEVGLRVR